MKSTLLRIGVVVALAVAASGGFAAAPGAQSTTAAVAFQSVGPLTFGPDGVLFAADIDAATIYALDLGSAATGGVPGTKAIAAVDRQLSGVLGSSPADVRITDLAVHPRTHNAFVSVMRGQGADAKPALLRIDGAGTIDLVDLASLKATKVALPNAPRAGGMRGGRTEAITDMAFMDGRLYVAGLSTEEFASKLRSLSYPFTAADSGTSVEIYHGSHGAFETRSPVYTFVPYRIDNAPHLIAGYLCTPLVKFPIASLRPGAKVMGTTIAELGSGNRPIDMILYKKDGREFLLMSNTNRGVMKIPTERFGSAPGITTPIPDKAGITYETIASMRGIEQLDLLDETHSLVLARASGSLNLDAVPLP